MPIKESMPTADVLFLIEGAGQGALGKNWGDGSATDPTIISARGLSDPNPFFSALLQKPYLSQVIIGPHVYPPSISMAQDETQVRPCMRVACPSCLLVCLAGRGVRHCQRNTGWQFLLFATLPGHPHLL